MSANAAAIVHRRRALNQFVREALVIPLTVVVLDVLRNRPPEMTFAERDHAMETLVLERAHEPLRVGIRVGCLTRCLHDSESAFGQLA